MEKVIEKISQYNLFNNLFPGTLFIIIINNMFNLDILEYNILIITVMAYFVGIVLSRIGSLIIEPCIKIKCQSYTDYLVAEKNDPMVKQLLQEKNMYRTILALILITLLCKIFQLISLKVKFNMNIIELIIGVLLLILFIFALKKQNKYICQRIKNQKN